MYKSLFVFLVFLVFLVHRQRALIGVVHVGEIYPDAHLLSGLTITALWAAAASLAPAMQRGRPWARTAHIAINTAAVLLFVGQIGTGLEVVRDILGWGAVQAIDVIDAASSTVG